MTWPSPDEPDRDGHRPERPSYDGGADGDPGWPAPDEPARDTRGLWLAIALLVVLVIGLLFAVLRGGRGPAEPGPPPGGAPPAPVSAGPTPRLPLVVDGYHYTVGVSPLVPVVQAPSAQSAPPGWHYLTATLVIRNDQTDRSAPALLDSDGAAPTVAVGLSPVDFLATSAAAAAAGVPTACGNDPRVNTSFDGPPPADYQGLAPHTCVVAAGVIPAHPVGSLADDSQLPPGGVVYGTVTSPALPDSLPITDARTWIATTSYTNTTVDTHSSYRAIP